jgi:hypothetical protein
LADELQALVDRAEYYRQLATLIRSRGSFMKSPEARDELSARAAEYESLAQYYEILAKYAESTATRSTLMGRLSEQQE